MNRTQTGTSTLVNTLAANPAARTASGGSAQELPLLPGAAAGALSLRKAPKLKSLRGARALWASIAVVGALLAAYAGQRWYAYARQWVGTDNAYVEAHIHTVSPRVAGTVKEVLVQENQWVAAGTVLARLDERDLAVQERQAQAQLLEAAAKVSQTAAKVNEAKAQVDSAHARATQAEQDLARAKVLYQGSAGAISKQEFDQAKAQCEAAQAQGQAAQAGLESAKAAATAAQAQQEVAQANLQQAQLQLSYAEIRAPAPGRIGRKNLEVGNRVQPGQAVLAVVEPGVWITANFKETQLARMRPGQVVRVALDAFPGHHFSGRVESLSPASGAQFALLPPDNATGNFTRIVQRVPVKVTLEKQSLGMWGERIVPGMSAEVRVKVGG